MPHRQYMRTMPATREPVSLLSVDRAVFELRRGRFVCIAAADGARALVMAAEGASPQSLKNLETLAGNIPILAITRRRADVLGLELKLDCADMDAESTVLTLSFPTVPDAETLMSLADPLFVPEPGTTFDRNYLSQGMHLHSSPRHGPCGAAVGLTKIARLLPAALVAPIRNIDAQDLLQWAARCDLQYVDAGDVFQYEHTTARTLRPVSEAHVPLSDAETTRIIAYRPYDGGLEHLAIVIGEPGSDPDKNAPALVRLHSECFTGDLLGSLRCDCGDQLRGAIQAIAADGAGVLLYLAQEGRGIGLVNKLRAYTLQDRGLDTLDANEQLGFDADERVYLPAAEMLKDLGLNRIRLLTNNPNKVSALIELDIDVTERVPHAFPSNKHNERYLLTKKAKGGHLF